MSSNAPRGKEKAKEIKISQLVDDVNRQYCYTPAATQSYYNMYIQQSHMYPYPYQQPYYPAHLCAYPADMPNIEVNKVIDTKIRRPSIDETMDEFTKIRSKIKLATNELKKDRCRSGSPIKVPKPTPVPRSVSQSNKRVSEKTSKLALQTNSQPIEKVKHRPKGSIFRTADPAAPSKTTGKWKAVAETPVQPPKSSETTTTRPKINDDVFVGKDGIPLSPIKDQGPCAVDVTKQHPVSMEISSDKLQTEDPIALHTDNNISNKLNDQGSYMNDSNQTDNTTFLDFILDKTTTEMDHTPSNLSLLESIDFTKHFIKINEKVVSLDKMIQRLQDKAFQLPKFSMKTFARENGAALSKIYLYFVEKTGNMADLTLHHVCSKILLRFPGTVRVAILKRLFKKSYRRHQIEQLSGQYDKLEINLKKSVESLEPGEEVDCIWDEEVAGAFADLITSKYNNTSTMTKNIEYQKMWMQKFLEHLIVNPKLWPTGTITLDFLKMKTVSLLPQLYTAPTLPADAKLLIADDVRTVRILIKSPSKTPSFKRKVPQKSSAPTKYKRSSSSSSKHTRSRDRSHDSSRHKHTSSHKKPYHDYDAPREVYYRKKRSHHRYSDSSSSSSHRKSRHRSDESHCVKDSSLRKKRYSDEMGGSHKRIKYDRCLNDGDLTSFDEKLRSCELEFDLFRDREEAPIRQVFATKEQDAPVQKKAESRTWIQIKAILDELENSDNSEEKETPKVEERKKKNAVDKDRKKSDILKEEYGEMSVEMQNMDKEFTAVLKIQGYLFEGYAPSQHGALEDASNKALIVAPYILKSR